MNILIHCRVKVKKILLKAFCEERVGKALDRLSHIRHTSTVFTLFWTGTQLFDKDKIVGKKEEKRVERKTLKGLLQRILKRF